MKIKALAIITVIILFVSYVPVYADTNIPNPPSDGYEYWAVYQNYGDDDIMMLTSGSPILVNNTGTSIIGGSPGNTGYKIYIYEGGKWVIIGGNENGGISTPIKSIIASNHDIAYSDGSGFFFLCPKVSPLYQGVKGTDFGTILANFSAGLIPLLGLLILAISLTKAWEFLRTQLSG